ncbi:hypothetical protein MJD09_02880, partial [bacterium]|nr:hypothetical protein [bacterium]
MKRPILYAMIALVAGSSHCDLYMNSDEPQDYYEFPEFDILTLGKNISDMIMDPEQPYLYLTDYGNNAVLRIDVSGEMKVDRTLVLGSHPIAMDITPDREYLIVGHNGESNLRIIELASFTAVDKVPVSLVGINDFVCASNSRVFISAYTEPNVVSLTLPGKEEQDEIIRSGELLASPDGNEIFVASTNILQKYDLSSGFTTQEAWSAPFGFQAKINDFVYDPSGEQVFLCLADQNDHTTVNDVLAFSASDLTLTGNFEVESAGMGVAISKDGKRIFVAPTDADEAGVFVVEFDAETKLEKDYYLVAGNLKAKCIAIDQNDEYLYVAVDSPGDSDSFEPYNN